MKYNLLLTFFVLSISLYSGTWKKIESMENGVYLYFDSYGSESYITTSYYEGKYPAGSEYFDYFLIETNDNGVSYDTLWSKRTIWSNPNRVKVKIGEAFYLEDKTIFGVGEISKTGEKFDRILTVKSDNIHDTLDFTFFDYQIDEYRPHFKNDSLFSLCLIGKDTSIVTIDQGNTWNEIILPDTNMKFIDLNILSKSELIALVDSANIRKISYSSDLGKNWNNIDINNKFLRIFFSNSLSGFATYLGASNKQIIYQTNDGGETWDEVLRHQGIYSSTEIEEIKIFNDSTYYSYSKKDLFYSSDKGTTWEYKPFEMNTGNILYLTEFDSKLLIIFMNDIGVYDNSTGIQMLNKNNNFKLFPNPVGKGEEFNISYNNTDISYLNIIIYDLTGKKVSTFNTNQILRAPKFKGQYIIEINEKQNKHYEKLIVK